MDTDDSISHRRNTYFWSHWNNARYQRLLSFEGVRVEQERDQNLSAPHGFQQEGLFGAAEFNAISDVLAGNATTVMHSYLRMSDMNGDSCNGDTWRDKTLGVAVPLSDHRHGFQHLQAMLQFRCSPTLRRDRRNPPSFERFGGWCGLQRPSSIVHPSTS